MAVNHHITASAHLCGYFTAGNLQTITRSFVIVQTVTSVAVRIQLNLCAGSCLGGTLYRSFGVSKSPNSVI